MASSISILIDDETGYSGTDRAVLKVSETGNRHLEINRLMDYLSGIGAGVTPATLKVDVDSVALAAATGTVTCATVVATDTVTINGVTFTAHATNQDEDEFAVGGTDAETATNLATAINANTNALVTRHVSASASGDVVTITAQIPGHAGNAVTLASSGATLAVSGARLTGGTGANSAAGPNTYNYGT